MLNFQIRREASRCLGELGPANVTTMILKPEKSQEFQENVSRNSSVFMFTSHTVNILVDYLVDENITVVETASAALYKIFSSSDGLRVLRRFLFLCECWMYERNYKKD
jgi:hypothetical protein